MASKKHHLASLQLDIMKILWEKEEASVADVRQALADRRPLAHTTIATMLTKMELKGHVTHRVEGRANIYRPAIEQRNVSISMVTDLADRLFSGDVTQMVSHLLDGCDVSTEELNRLKALIRRKEREERDER